VRWFGTSTDVEMERRAAEATVALRQREQMLRQEAELQKRQLHALFMQAPMLIAVLRGPDHVIELANPPICQVWRRPASEIVNRSIFDVLPEIGTVELRAVLDGVYRTGVPHLGAETPVAVEGPTGGTETGYVTYVYSPYRTIDGAVDGIFVIASDVTAQVVARYQGNALREAAEAANRAKDEFLAMLGHELRNPLSPILTALQLMKLRAGIGAERERTIIERQVNHLTRLVDDLLDVSRIARGKVELKEETVELATIVNEAIEVSAPIVEQRSHTLDVRVPREGLAVRGDPTRLGQVVSNLLTNAAKYTPPGGRVTVRASAEHGEVVLRVADTGIGIAPEVLPRIFDLFVQERHALDRSQGGLGLGLTIARNLIERHGGTIRAWSAGIGQGSEFVVRLPRVSPSTGAGESGAEAGPTAVTPAAGAIRALIVDDNADGAEMLAAALGAKGIETRVATDPLSALQIAADYAPDVAFLDIGLPVMDGFELVARLKAMPHLTAARFVAVTGFGQSSDRRRTADAGFHHHLVKPVDLRAIDAVIADLAPPPRA
jgi:signal transduction histidine kinase